MTVDQLQVDRSGRKIVFSNCPKCRSSEIDATESHRMNGSSKIQIVCTLDCESCGYHREYTTSMT